MAALRNPVSPSQARLVVVHRPAPVPAVIPPPPAVTIQVSGGSEAVGATAPHLRLRVLDTLPAAERALLVGCADAALAHDHKARHPGCEWHAVDDRPDLLGQAVDGFDSRTCLPLDGLGALDRGAPFDLIVLDDVVHRCAAPRALFEQLASLATPQAALVLGFTNQAQIGNLTRIVEADLSNSEYGPVPAGSLQQFSASSLYKCLMDAGWMPALKSHSLNDSCPDQVAAAALALADALAIPHATAKATLRMDRMVIEARRIFGAVPQGPAQASFSVVVPTTRPNQLQLNVESSPGLKEVGARVVSCRGAANPAQALEQSLPHCDADWVLLCHQDIYLPAGFGHRLNALLAGIPAEERRTSLLGFVGMAVNAQGDGYAESGFVIDRLSRIDFADLPRAVSIDELAIVVARDSVHRIDPSMGWHLWATDLCLRSICEHKVFARMVRLPIFHNSCSDHRLPELFYDSARRLLEKHPQFEPIPSLCARIDRRWLEARAA